MTPPGGWSPEVGRPGGRRRAAEERVPGGGQAGIAPAPGSVTGATPPGGWAPERVVEHAFGMGAPGPGAEPRPAGATVAPGGWRRGLRTVLRLEWLLALAAYVGLVYPTTAPYTAGAVAGLGVLLCAYGWTRRHTMPRPERADRLPTALVAAAAAALAVVIPAAMLGAMSGARAAAIAAVTSATAAALALGRPAPRRT
jgi:hypothetical protein